MDQESGLHRSAETLAPKVRGLLVRIRREAPLGVLELTFALAAYLVTLVLRFDGSVPSAYWGNFWIFVFAALVGHLTTNHKDLTILVEEEEFGMGAAELAEAPAAEGIQTRRYAPTVHRQHAHRAFRPSKGSLPVTDAAAARVLTLPLWVGMGEERIDAVGAAIARLAWSR